MAVSAKPKLFKSASSPKAVLKLVKQPSWQTARACGESANQTSTSATRRNAHKGERPTNFTCGVFIFLFFPFVMRANHLLTVTLRKVGQVDLWGRRLNNLARADLAAPARPVSTLFFPGKQKIIERIWPTWQDELERCDSRLREHEGEFKEW